MKQFILLLTALSATVCMAQRKNVAGTYSSNVTGINEVKVTLREDSTFQYYASRHPVFDTWEGFSEGGKWTISGDTIILNPQLTPKVAIQTDFQEEEVTGDTALTLTFNHVKRYFNSQEDLTRTDTEQIRYVEFQFNGWKRNASIRVSPEEGGRYVAKEIVTNSRTIVIPRPTVPLNSFLVFCFETARLNELIIRKPKSTHLTFTLFYNYYPYQLRQKKLLIKNENALFTKQKANGKFYKEFSGLEPGFKLTRVKVSK